jgi:2-methylisocitrate lyase-like PEP mutase family enzyme
MTLRAPLRARLCDPHILVVPGVYDALSAALAERAGFQAVYLSGASIAYTRLGRPDIGLTTVSEVENVLGNIRERTALPVIVDADTGFGNAINVQRTVRMLERAAGPGTLAIQLEDQTSPKRCGHLDGKTLVSTAEMCGKIRAALDARASADTLVVARTDAVAVEGLEAALDRADAYADAGADVLFVEAVRSDEQMRATTSRLRARTPLLVNMVEGGKTPLRPASELEALGFSLVIYPGGAVRALVQALGEYYGVLAEHGTSEPFRDRMLDFDRLQATLGTAELLAQGKRYGD